MKNRKVIRKQINEHIFAMNKTKDGTAKEIMQQQLNQLISLEIEAMLKELELRVHSVNMQEQI